MWISRTDCQVQVQNIVRKAQVLTVIDSPSQLGSEVLEGFSPMVPSPCPGRASSGYQVGIHSALHFPSSSSSPTSQDEENQFATSPRCCMNLYGTHSSPYMASLTRSFIRPSGARANDSLYYKYGKVSESPPRRSPYAARVFSRSGPQRHIRIGTTLIEGILSTSTGPSTPKPRRCESFRTCLL